MHDWRLAGFFVMTCFVAFGVSASGTGGGSANGATSESLTGTGWALVRDSTAVSTSGPDAESTIRFDLDRLDADGLQGPPDGLRALHYEYCIPDRPEAIREVTAIDPTLQIQRGSPGRVGCGAGELLCLGITHQSGYRTVLERLAALPFVAEIHEAFFE